MEMELWLHRTFQDLRRESTEAKRKTKLKRPTEEQKAYEQGKYDAYRDAMCIIESRWNGN